VGNATDPQTGNRVTIVMRNNGNGTFGAPVGYATGGDTRIQIGDINQDGYADLVVGSAASNGFYVLTNDQAGGFTSTFYNQGFAPLALAIRDLNGDSYSDIIVGYNNAGGGYVDIWQGNALGGFGTSAAYTITAAAGLSDIAVGDFDGDAKPDIAVGEPGPLSEVEVFLNTTPILPGGGGM